MIDTLTRSLTAEPQTAFRNLITEPLESVLGRPLLSVSYWLLDYDQAEFSVEQPNEIGILFVSLQFGGGTLELSWGFDKSLRGNDLAYHIQVVPAGQAGSLARMDTGSLFEIAEVRASPWQEVIGKRLTGVEAVGLQGSPQAVRFSFSETDVVVAIGYAGSEHDLAVCDGDDLLVFSDREWKSQKSGYDLVWTSKTS